MNEAKKRAARWARASARMEDATPTAKVQYAAQLLAAVVAARQAHFHPLVDDLTRQLVEAARTIEEEART